jgi:hypothetical protein
MTTTLTENDTCVERDEAASAIVGDDKLALTVEETVDLMRAAWNDGFRYGQMSDAERAAHDERTQELRERLEQLGPA